MHEKAMSAFIEHNLLHTLGSNTPDLLYAKDWDNRFIYANQTTAEFMGVDSPLDLLGKTDFDFYPKMLASKYSIDECAIMASGEALLNHEEPCVYRKTGEERWLLTSKVPIRDDGGQVVGIVGIGRDITDKRATVRALRESEQRFKSLAELSSDWYWEQDKDGRFICIEDADKKSSYIQENIVGKALWELEDTFPLSGSWIAHRDRWEAREPFRDLELRHLTDQGEVAYYSMSGRPVFNESGECIGYRGVGRDVTERKRSEERIQYMATHDGLTALPNRVMFSEILSFAIDSARRYGRKLALLFVDLDRFKNINDILGHGAGDLLLKEIARRLTHCLRASDVVARLGGDEFVILVQEVNQREQVEVVARKVLSTVIQPMNILRQECRVTASIGICLYPGDAGNEEELMKNADIAMYRAKEEGKNNYQFYTPGIRNQSLERLALENNLRRALERDEFFLEYQAKRNLQTGDIAGVEALLRWRHPELGVIAPVQFIPLAEETGLIVPIGRWVLEQACRQQVQWEKEGIPPLCMAVNLSARQFYDDHLVQDIANVLNKTGMSSNHLEMEITEGMVMQNVERATKVLRDIKALGVRLAIDDFGVGYSSLAQIKQFPIDTLKVDRSFIRDIPNSTEDRAITQAIIAMGKTLSLTVIAEGVETAEQEAFLKEQMCDESQGFYFSRPMEPGKFAEFVRLQGTPARQNVPLDDGE